MLKVQRIGLGTVQWGMPYGISNQIGVPTAEMVKSILACSSDAGMTVLDTAWAYGGAERVIGEQGALAAGFNIVTKTRPLKGLNINPDESADVVEEAFLSSLLKLGRMSVNGLLVHHADDLLGPSGHAIWAKLQQLRSEGKVNKIGCSIYHPEQFTQLLDRYELEMVQLPYNIYDQRYVSSGMADKARAKGVEVHVRSVFLQGLLLMQPDRLPVHFASLRDRHAVLWAKYEEFGLSPLQAALLFCLASPGVDRVIVGCEQLGQLLDIITAARVMIPSGLVAAMGDFAISEEYVINPALWILKAGKV